MLFPALTREPWGRTLQRSDVESCLLKAAAAGHWVAALDLCATVKQLSVAAVAEQEDRSGRSSTAMSLDCCCVDPKGQSLVGVAADHGHWFTAWVLVEKAKMNISHLLDDEAVSAAVQRGAELASQVKATQMKAEESARQAAAAAAATEAAEKSSEPQVIHVDDDDDLLCTDDDFGCSNSSDTDVSIDDSDVMLNWIVKAEKQPRKKKTLPHCRKTQAVARKTTRKTVVVHSSQFRDASSISSDESEEEEERVVPRKKGRLLSKWALAKTEAEKQPRKKAFPLCRKTEAPAAAAKKTTRKIADQFCDALSISSEEDEKEQLNLGRRRKLLQRK